MKKIDDLKVQGQEEPLGEQIRQQETIISKPEIEDVHPAVDLVTGEELINEIKAPPIPKDFSYFKMFYKNVLQDLAIIGNVNIKVLCHILNNMNRKNEFMGQHKQVARILGISKRQANTAFKKLISHNFIKKKHRGYYMVNPFYFFYGLYDKRMFAVQAYYNPEGYTDKKLSKEKQIEYQQQLIRENEQKRAILVKELEELIKGSFEE